MDIKPQDIIFIIMLVGLLRTRRPQWFVVVALLMILFAIPLFAFTIFFTAQRLIYYAVALLVFAIIFKLLER